MLTIVKTDRAKTVICSSLSERSDHSVTQRKYFCFFFSKLVIKLRRPASITRGVSRSSRTLGAGCGGLSDLQRGFARTNRSGRTAKSRGSGAPALVSRSLSSTFGDRRGQASRSPGRARISRKPIAQGRPVIWLILWFCRVLFVARGPWVSADTRPSLRPPFDKRADVSHNSGVERAARMPRHAKLATKRMKDTI
jgi:hypothetical protein